MVRRVAAAAVKINVTKPEGMKNERVKEEPLALGEEVAKEAPNFKHLEEIVSRTDSLKMQFNQCPKKVSQDLGSVTNLESK